MMSTLPSVYTVLCRLPHISVLEFSGDPALSFNKFFIKNG